MCVTSLPTCVCVCVCVCARALSLSQNSIPVDAVISEDVAVYVSALRDKNMFRDSATAACHLFFIIIDHQQIGHTKAL